MIDQVSLDRISKLHPKIREDVTKAVEDSNKVLTGEAKLRIASGYRSFEEQQALYDQGRTKPGKRVTNALPGKSYHNYGLAVDIVLIINGNEASWNTKKDWDKDKQSDWMEVVAVFKKYGFDWGGDWRTFKDLPHFEKVFGLSTTKLKNKYTAGQVDNEGYVII